MLRYPFFLFFFLAHRSLASSAALSRGLMRCVPVISSGTGLPVKRPTKYALFSSSSHGLPEAAAITSKPQNLLWIMTYVGRSKSAKLQTSSKPEDFSTLSSGRLRACTLPWPLVTKEPRGGASRAFFLEHIPLNVHREQHVLVRLWAVTQAAQKGRVGVMPHLSNCWRIDIYQLFVTSRRLIDRAEMLFGNGRLLRALGPPLGPQKLIQVA
jgi:hypothetical protein